MKRKYLLGSAIEDKWVCTELKFQVSGGGQNFRITAVIRRPGLESAMLNVPK